MIENGDANPAHRSGGGLSALVAAGAMEAEPVGDIDQQSFAILVVGRPGNAEVEFHGAIRAIGTAEDLVARESR